MDELLTATALAKQIGCAPSTVTRCVARLAIGTRLGPVVVLTGVEAERVRASVRGGPGNPNFASSASEIGATGGRGRKKSPPAKESAEPDLPPDSGVTTRPKKKRKKSG